MPALKIHGLHSSTGNLGAGLYLEVSATDDAGVDLPGLHKTLFLPPDVLTMQAPDLIKALVGGDAATVRSMVLALIPQLDSDLSLENIAAVLKGQQAKQAALEAAKGLELQLETALLDAKLEFPITIKLDMQK